MVFRWLPNIIWNFGVFNLWALMSELRMDPIPCCCPLLSPCESGAIHSNKYFLWIMNLYGEALADRPLGFCKMFLSSLKLGLSPLPQNCLAVHDNFLFWSASLLLDWVHAAFASIVCSHIVHSPRDGLTHSIFQNMLTAISMVAGKPSMKGPFVHTSIYKNAFLYLTTVALGTSASGTDVWLAAFLCDAISNVTIRPVRF